MRFVHYLSFAYKPFVKYLLTGYFFSFEYFFFFSDQFLWVFFPPSLSLAPLALHEFLKRNVYSQENKTERGKKYYKIDVPRDFSLLGQNKMVEFQGLNNLVSPRWVWRPTAAEDKKKVGKKHEKYLLKTA